MASLASLMVEVGADISAFTQSMNHVQTQMSQVGSSISSMGSSLQQTGQSMAMSISAPLIAFGGLAIKAFGDSEEASARLQGSLGLTEAGVQGLLESAKNIYKEGFGESLDEVATHLARVKSALRLDDEGAIEDLTRKAMSLSKVIDTDVNEVTKTAWSLMSNLGMTGDEAMDMIAKGAQIGLNTSGDWLDTLWEYAPTFKEMGLSSQEMFNMYVAGAEAGAFNTDKMGDSLKEFGVLNQEVTKKSSDAYKTLGLDAGKMTKALASGGQEGADAFGIITMALAGVDNEVKRNELGIAMMGTMWEDLGEDVVLAMVNGKDSVVEFTGASDQMQDSVSETPFMRLKGAIRSLMDSLVPLGEALMNVFDTVMPYIISFAEKVSTMFDSLPMGAKLGVVAFGIFLVALAPMLIMVGLVAQGIGALITVFGAVSAPVLAIVAGIALLIAGLAIAYAKFEPFRNAVNKVFLGIKSVVMQAVGAVVAFVQEKLAQIRQFWDENGEGILTAVKTVWGFIAPIIQGALTVALFVVQYIWNAIKGVIDGALGIIIGLVRIFSGLFTGDFSKMWEGVKQLFLGAVQFVWNLMSLTFVRGVLKAITSLAKGALNGVRGMWDTIRLQFMYGKDRVIAFINALRSGGISAFNSMGSALKSIAQGIWNFIKSIFSKMASTVSSIFNGIKSVASSVWNGIKSTIIGIAMALYNGITSRFEAVRSRASSIFNSVRTAITRPIESAKSTVLGIVNTIKNAFNNMRITIPKPKIPKVSVAMSENALGIPVPKFSVNWNAKGGIYNGASILGGGQGVGEAGAEAVVPIQHKRYMAPFAGAIADHLNKYSGGETDGTIVNNFNFESLVVREEADIKKIAEELNRVQEQKKRMGGRVTYGN